MILIEEKASQGLGGLTSLFVSFDYNNSIIEQLKQLETYSYSKKTHLWEYPLNSLSELVDRLSRIDDIKLKFIDKVENHNTHLILNYKLQPYKYQEEGIKYGLSHDNWLLLDEMGLGKTAQIIGLARELKAQNGLKHCLIICGLSSLKVNWEKEIHKHSDESCIILGKKVSKTGRITYDTLEERANQLNNPIEEFFIITNIESLRNDNVVKALKHNVNNIDMCVVDEIHKCKGYNSIQGNNLLSLTNFKYKIASTGTLILNNIIDAYVPLKWTCNNNSCVSNYKNTYCIFDKHIKGRILGSKNTDLLKDQLSECSLRRTKADIFKELPEKTIIDEYVELEPIHQQFYENIVNQVKNDKLKVTLNKSNLLALSVRLRQASIAPTMLTTEKIVSSKIERAIDLIKDITNNGDKVVVFSDFKEPCYILGSMLKELNPYICTGDSKEAYISNAIDDFQNNSNSRVIVATTQKLGTGVTLTSASYCIFLDMPYTAALYQQAYSRIYRIGTEKPVFIYNLIGVGTIDERIAQIVKRKEAISNYIIDDKIDSQEDLMLLQQYIQDL